MIEERAMGGLGGQVWNGEVFNGDFFDFETFCELRCIFLGGVNIEKDLIVVIGIIFLFSYRSIDPVVVCNWEQETTK